MEGDPAALPESPGEVDSGHLLKAQINSLAFMD